MLSKVPELKVSARTSAFSFKGKDTPVPEIAKQLGVAYVVEGKRAKVGQSRPDYRAIDQRVGRIPRLVGQL